MHLRQSQAGRYIGTIAWKSYDIDRPHTTVVQGLRFHYDFLVINWNHHRNTINVPRRRTTMAQQHEKVVQLRKCENMAWIAVTSHGVEIYRTTSRYGRTVPYNLWIRIQVFNMIKNRQYVVRGSPMAATSYNVGRLRTIHTRSSTIIQTSSITRLV